MFFCNECAKKYNWPESMFKSRGKCECCEKVTVCNNIPSRELPLPPKTQGARDNDTR